MTEREIKRAVLANGKAPFDDWFVSLDPALQAAVDARIARVRAGNLGDHKSVGSGVVELRIAKGPGLRVYLGQLGSTVVVLLGGGSKRAQQVDIGRAQQLWSQIKQYGAKRL